MSADADALALAARIAADHGLTPLLTRFASGSVPVFSVGAEHVIKLFPADEERHFRVEVAALARIAGGLSVPTPRLVASGERDGWWYVAMTRLHGLELADVWPSIPPADRVVLVRQAGRAISELHALPTDDLEALDADWGAFVAGQLASSVSRQAARGLGAPWLDQIEPFLARWAPTDDGRRVLLHTEVMREHLIVQEHQRAWWLSGLFDFEPAMIGPPGYEFASVGLFVSCAEPGLLAALLDGYGEPVDASPCRLMAWCLLHRYSNLRWYLTRLPVPAGVETLEGLAEAWFSG